MAALVCDLCGGKLMMGAGGIAICDNCGMEHSADRMKEKIQGNTGAPQASNTHLIDNYVRMAQNAYSSNNKEEAENYCNKIIEIDPCHQQAWLLKGKAAGWQSTLSNIRFTEAINCFANAIENTDEDERESVIAECEQEIKELAEALIRLRGGRFAKWPDAEEKNGFIQDLTAVLQAIIQFYNNVGTLIDKDAIMSSLATIINNFVIDAWSDVIRPTFENDHNGYPDDYELKRLVERGDYCTALIKHAIDLSDSDEQGNIQRYKNLLGIEEYLINAQSYSYETVAIQGTFWNDYQTTYENQYVKSKTLTEEAKRIRRQEISTYRNKIKSIESAIAARKAAEKAEKERIAREEAQRRFNEYWAKHAEEKEALQTEKESLESQIKSLNNSLNAQVEEINKEVVVIPGDTEIADLEARIHQLTSEKNALGFFKGREKKALQGKIDQFSSEIKEIRNRMEAAEREHKEKIKAKIAAVKEEMQKKITPMQQRVKAINHELTKAR